jgi:hypothetical protein
MILCWMRTVIVTNELERTWKEATIYSKLLTHNLIILCVHFTFSHACYTPSSHLPSRYIRTDTCWRERTWKTSGRTTSSGLLFFPPSWIQIPSAAFCYLIYIHPQIWSTIFIYKTQNYTSVYFNHVDNATWGRKHIYLNACAQPQIEDSTEHKVISQFTFNLWNPINTSACLCFWSRAQRFYLYRSDCLCGLVVRVPGYRTEAYCVSC